MLAEIIYGIMMHFMIRRLFIINANLSFDRKWMESQVIHKSVSAGALL